MWPVWSRHFGPVVEKKPLGSLLEMIKVSPTPNFATDVLSGGLTPKCRTDSKVGRF
jgi:hypothetical protein